MYQTAAAGPHSCSRPLALLQCAPMHAGFARIEISPAPDHAAVHNLGFWNWRSLPFASIRERMHVRAAALHVAAAQQAIANQPAAPATETSSARV